MHKIDFLGDLAKAVDSEGRKAFDTFLVSAQGLLFECAKHEHLLKLMSILIDAGAPVNVTDNNGNSPLHYASYSGNTGCIQLLIARGALVECYNLNKQNPIYAACESKQWMAARILFDYDADVMAKDSAGKNSIDKAIELQAVELLSYMADKKSDVLDYMRGKITLTETFALWYDQLVTDSSVNDLSAPVINDIMILLSRLPFHNKGRISTINTELSLKATQMKTNKLIKI